MPIPPRSTADTARLQINRGQQSVSSCFPVLYVGRAVSLNQPLYRREGVVSLWTGTLYLVRDSTLIVPRRFRLDRAWACERSGGSGLKLAWMVEQAIDEEGQSHDHEKAADADAFIHRAP